MKRACLFAMLTANLSAEKLTYPDSHPKPLKETIHGVEVSDDYRWLFGADVTPILLSTPLAEQPGERWDYKGDGDYEAGAFWNTPTIRRPGSASLLVDNEHDFDKDAVEIQISRYCKGAERGRCKTEVHAV